MAEEDATATAEAPAGAGVDPEIQELGDKLVGLTLKQAVDLGEYLKQTYGIEPAAGGAVVAQAPAGGGEAAEEEEEKTEFDVVLKDPGDEKIKVIKVVREATGLGLKEAKEVVENTPKTLKEAMPKEEAQALQEKVKEVGGTIELQ